MKNKQGTQKLQSSSSTQASQRTNQSVQDTSVSVSSNNIWKVTREDIELAKKAYERCVKRFMNKDDILKVTFAGVDPQVTNSVREKMEEDKGEIFRTIQKLSSSFNQRSRPDPADLKIINEDLSKVLDEIYEHVHGPSSNSDKEEKPQKLKIIIVHIKDRTCLK